MIRNLNLTVVALALVALGCGGDDGSDTAAESSGGVAGEAGAGGAAGEAGAGGAAGTGFLNCTAGTSGFVRLTINGTDYDFTSSGTHTV